MAKQWSDVESLLHRNVLTKAPVFVMARFSFLGSVYTMYPIGVNFVGSRFSFSMFIVAYKALTVCHPYEK